MGHGSTHLSSQNYEGRGQWISVRSRSVFGFTYWVVPGATRETLSQCPPPHKGNNRILDLVHYKDDKRENPAQMWYCHLQPQHSRIRGRKWAQSQPELHSKKRGGGNDTNYHQKQNQWDGICHSSLTTWQPEFSSWNLHSRRRKPTAKSCPPSPAGTPQTAHMCLHSHLHIMHTLK